MEKVVITAAVAGVYERGQGGALLADELLCGMGAEIIAKTTGDMVHVHSEYGYEGYVNYDSFLPDDGQWQTVPKLIVTGSYINVQIQPMMRSVVLLSLPRGSLVQGEGPSVEGWQPVLLAGGQRGYVQSLHLARYPMGDGQEDGMRNSLCQNALSYMGSCYRWGGKTPLGIDCSGLCAQVYFNHGIPIYRDAKILDGFPVRKIEMEALKPADLLYWRGHMALWLGDGRYIHSAASSGGVTVNSLVKGEVDYRDDLAKTLLACGSVFDV